MSTSNNTGNNLPGKPKSTTALLAATIAGVALAAFFAGRGSSPLPPSNPVAGPTQTAGHEEEGHGEEEIKFEGRMEGITLAPVASQQQTSGIPFNGQLAPDPNGFVRVSSLVPGRVHALFAAPGDKVRKGQRLAVIESRAVGEAQSAYHQATARFNSAKANLDVVNKQARAGVFSRTPIEAARREVVQARAGVKAQETQARMARTTLDNVLRQARAGSFADPALEAARLQKAAANESLATSQAALDNAEAEVAAAEKEWERRKQLAAGGAYVARPVEEAHRSLTAARSARTAAQSEVTTTRANLNRSQSLFAEGLVSKRDVEAAKNAAEAAEAHLETAHSAQTTAQSEWERQQKLAATGAAGAAEVQAAQSALLSARAGVRARRAEVARAREGLRLAQTQLAREQKIFQQNIANSRETSTAQNALETAQNALTRARQDLDLANKAHAREQSIFKQNLNNIAQVQAARSTFIQARADLQAARTTLSLFKSSPGGHTSIPIVAPIDGVVQERLAAPGEVLSGDSPLMTLVNLETLIVEITLNERDIARVHIGSPVRTGIDSLPGRQFSGRISSIGTRLDPDTRTLTARAYIPNSGTLKIGMFTRGQIVTRSSDRAITVPAAAIQKLENESVVFVAASEPNTFVAREVEPGDTQNGRTVIKNGLKPGERVVVKGAFIVKAQAMKAELGHSH